MIYESRTWEQMKADNAGAAWIDENGEFCGKYERDYSRLDPALMRQGVPEWAQTGFNGCWSCVHFDECHHLKPPPMCGEGGI